MGIVADLMNTVERQVASRRLDRAECTNREVLRGAAAETVADLKRGPGKDVYVFGSGELCRMLMSAGHVDEIRLCLAPIVLGHGMPLSGQDGRSDFDLLTARPLTNGSVFLRYGVGGAGRDA